MRMKFNKLNRLNKKNKLTPEINICINLFILFIFIVRLKYIRYILGIDLYKFERIIQKILTHKLY